MPMKKVLVTGSFNILHPGHLRLLRFARECGDHLTVAVASDRMAGRAAYMSEHHRLEALRCNSWVDEALLLDEPVESFILRTRPDIVVKGKEHESRVNPEPAALKQYGGRLLFSSGESIFSSMDLLRREFSETSPQTIRLPEDFLARHEITPQGLASLVRRFADLRVCVVGDLIVDEYITCQPLGMSQEDPTIVVTPIDSTLFLGGAGIVAGHGAGLGAGTSFFSVSGDDPARAFALKQLAGHGVAAHILTDDSRPTTLKQRFRSRGKTLLRVSRLHQGPISAALQEQLLERLTAELEHADLLIFSDFNYGCLPQPLVDKAIALAADRGVIMAADSQASSQVGNVARFRGMRLITPTEREARLALRNTEDGLVVLAEQLRRKADAANILLTLGEEGLLIHAGTLESWLTDRIGALNAAPRDVAGAGDSLLMTASLTLASGGAIWEAACLGSLAAAVQVGRVGNTPVQKAELLRELHGETE
jgi:rfaE bifunctional protein kinase chain/domain